MIALLALYAEGVLQQSPGSPRSGAPWVNKRQTRYTEGVTPVVDGVSASSMTHAMCNPFGVGTVPGISTQGALRDPYSSSCTPTETQATAAEALPHTAAGVAC